MPILGCGRRWSARSKVPDLRELGRPLRVNRTGGGDCVTFDARPGATVQLLTDGGVAIGLRSRGRFAIRVARPDDSVRGLDNATLLDPNTAYVLNVGPIEAGALVLTLSPGPTRLCGIS